MITQILRRLWPDISFTLQWSIATICGFVFGYVCGPEVFSSIVVGIEPVPGELVWLLAGAIALFLFGLGLGALQAGIMQPRMRMGGWAPTTGVGMAVGLLLTWAFISVRIFGDNAWLYFTVMGIAPSLTQWLVLRHKLAGAGWWIVANALVWGLCGAIGTLLGSQRGDIIMLLTLIAYSVIGGIVMSRLLRRPVEAHTGA